MYLSSNVPDVEPEMLVCEKAQMSESSWFVFGFAVPQVDGAVNDEKSSVTGTLNWVELHWARACKPAANQRTATAAQPFRHLPFGCA